MTSQTPADSAPTLTEIVLPGIVDPDGVLVRRRPIPRPGKGQVLVEMLATGVSFAENSMRRNRYPGQPSFPFVLGYDLVGVVTAVGPGVDPTLDGRRVAAVTKTGGWSTHVLLGDEDVIPVPDDLDPGEIETVLLNGITAWQMLHRSAKVEAGGTILVHGASGGVGMVLLQLARDAGIRVIGTGSPRNHETMRGLGAEPLDYHDPAISDQVRRLAPDGVDAVFDNIGGASFSRSFAQLAPGGTLVGYGTASQREDTDNMILTFVGILSRFALWTLRPNHGRSATFYNFWAGKTVRPTAFHRHLADDLARVLERLRSGALVAQVAARLPLPEAAEGLRLAESGTVQGKVILIPPTVPSRSG